MDKLEKKLGRFAIPNLTLALIIGYALGYIITYVDRFRGTDFISFLYLDPWKIIHGQVWRLVTWLIVPPSEANILFIALMMWCCLSIGMVLERTWGTFRFNIYIFGGVLLTILASFASLLFAYLSLGADYFVFYENEKMVNWAAFSTYYINVSIYLGFAMTYPNNIVRFMFIIPVKMKWLGLVDILYMIYLLVMGNAFTRFAVGAAMLNILLFYLINMKHFSFKNTVRKAKWGKAYRSGQNRADRADFSGQWQNTAQYRERTSSGQTSNMGSVDVKMRAPGEARHKCSICGQTEISNPSLEFRYCSKCRGNYEYCQEHLFTHTHRS